jgi:hypothetical protein
VAICFYGRSGSFLLHSLLDNHPDVVAVPPFLLLQSFYPFWDTFGGLPVNELVTAFIQQHQPWFSATALRDGPQAPLFGPEGKDDISVDATVFGAALRRHLEDAGQPGATTTTRRRFFQAIQVAYQDALGRRVRSSDPLVVFSLHTPSVEYARLLSDDFPDVRFIHVVREPVSTFGAHLFHHLYEFPQPPFENFPARMLDMLLGSDRYLVEGRTSSAAVRFEDLHMDPEPTMRRLASWLDLAWDPELLRTSYNGVLASHQKNGALISGLDPARARYRPPATLHIIDRAVLRLLLWQNRELWGYRWNGHPRLPLRVRRSRLGAIATTIRYVITSTLLWVPAKYEYLAWKLAWAAQEPGPDGTINRAAMVRTLFRQYLLLRQALSDEAALRRTPQPVVPTLSQVAST